jgi:serine/threonine protein kinase
LIVSICCLQALLAVNHLHSKKIIHRDIKSLNLFLTQSGDIMLGDLGIARAMSENTQFLKSLVGTPYYLSPELCNDKPYNEKSDIWALGVVLYEMCMTVHPFTARNEGALVRKILTGVYSPVKGYSSQVYARAGVCMDVCCVGSNCLKVEVTVLLCFRGVPCLTEFVLCRILGQ